MKQIKFILYIYGLVYVQCYEERMLVRFPPELASHVNNGVAECASKGDNVPEFIRIIHHGFYNDDPRFKQFMECLLKTTGYAEDSGKLHVDKVAEVFPDKERMAKLVTDCNNKAVNEAPEEVTYHVFKCIQMNSPYAVHF